MGKNKGKLGKTVQKKDVFQRLNYLYQASHTALSMNPPNVELARYYAATMKTLALRNVVRLSPHIKRTMCKKCHMLLVPGVTSTVRSTSGKQKYLVISCLECRSIKKFLLHPDHLLWNDKPEHISNIITIKPD